jgi:hypothetical protein
VDGDYRVEVVTEDGASSAATYSVGIRVNGTDEAMLTVDAEVPPEGYYDTLDYYVEEDWHFVNGDADRDATVNILDIVFIINYLYKSGDEPWPIVAADANCNGEINILDVVYLINYKYKNGPEPCVPSEKK